MSTRSTLLIVLVSLLAVTACRKEDKNTELGGSTNIPLTQVDSVSGVGLKYNGQALNTSSSLKVKRNSNGIVTYEGVFDLSTLSPELKLKAAELAQQLLEYDGYALDSSKVQITPEGLVKFEFDLKVTSEGYLDYFTEGKPWVMVRYDDGVGTEYGITKANGEKLTRRITEKTGVDEWPFAFWLIKTQLVEQYAASDDPVLEKVSYRVNHRFGLVWVRYDLKDGTNLELGIYAYFV
jgi:hypothetical protein